MKFSSVFWMNRGFTMVEILTVIAIVGILSTVVVASLNGARQKGRDTRRVADLKQLEVSLELYYRENRAYPTTGGQIWIENRCSSLLAGWVRKTNYFGSNAYIPSLAPQYIQTLPGDPRVNSVTNRCYGYSSDGQKYFLWAYLGIEGSLDTTSPMVRLLPSGCSTAHRTFFVGRNIAWSGGTPRCFNSI